MNKTVGFIIAAFSVLLFATIMLIVIPSIQLAQVPAEEGLKPYSEIEQKGRDVYVSEGCVYCHSQQPGTVDHFPDQKRGWGRPSTPGDYAYDYPHLLGTMRTGPDLFNIGVRQPSEEWHYLHLYQPRAVSPASIMPAYPFLFKEVSAIGASDVEVRVPPQFRKDDGLVIATPDAIALVAYLKSLKRDYPAKQSIFGAKRDAAGEGK